MNTMSLQVKEDEDGVELKFFWILRFKEDEDGVEGNIRKNIICCLFYYI